MFITYHLMPLCSTWKLMGRLTVSLDAADMHGGLALRAHFQCNLLMV